MKLHVTENYCRRYFFCGVLKAKGSCYRKTYFFVQMFDYVQCPQKKSNGRSIICFVLFFFHYQAVIIFICRFIIIRIINNMTATAAAVFLFFCFVGAYTKFCVLLLIFIFSLPLLLFRHLLIRIIHFSPHRHIGT